MVTNEDILRVIAEASDLSVPAAKLQADVPLVNQGLDSLDLATLMLAVESKFKKPITPEQTTQMRTLKDIVDFLNG